MNFKRNSRRLWAMVAIPVAPSAKNKDRIVNSASLRRPTKTMSLKAMKVKPMKRKKKVKPMKRQKTGRSPGWQVAKALAQETGIRQKECAKLVTFLKLNSQTTRSCNVPGVCRVEKVVKPWKVDEKRGFEDLKSETIAKAMENLTRSNRRLAEAMENFTG